jgi:hypothetical protein
VWGSGGTASTFLTSALDGGEWSASRPSRSITAEIASSLQFIGSWVGRRTSLDVMEKRKIPAPVGNRIQAFQPLTRRYTGSNLCYCKLSNTHAPRMRITCGSSPTQTLDQLMDASLILFSFSSTLKYATAVFTPADLIHSSCRISRRTITSTIDTT